MFLPPKRPTKFVLAKQVECWRTTSVPVTINGFEDTGTASRRCQYNFYFSEESYRQIHFTTFLS